MEGSRHESKTVHKAVQLLQALASAPEARGVTELARLLGLQKSVAHSLLTTLSSAGLVEQDPETRQYRLGIGIFELGQVVARRMTVRNVALPVMTILANELNESVHLVVPRGRMGLCVEEVVPTGQFRLTFAPGTTGPLHAGASFKAILAFLEESEIEHYLDTGLEALTGGTVTDPERLRAELTEIQQLGYASSNGELYLGASAVAAPVYNSVGRVVASLSAAGTTPQIAPHVPQIARKVIEAARKISADLGYQSERLVAGAGFDSKR